MWFCSVLQTRGLRSRPNKYAVQVPPSRSPTPLFWRNVVLPKPYHIVGDRKERWHESFPKWQSLFQYSHTTEWGKLFTQNIKYKKYNTIYLYIIMILLVSIKCCREKTSRGLGGGSRKEILCSWQYTEPFYDFIVKRWRRWDTVTRTEPRAVTQGDISTAVISVSFTLVICLVS